MIKLNKARGVKVRSLVATALTTGALVVAGALPATAATPEVISVVLSNETSSHDFAVPLFSGTTIVPGAYGSAKVRVTNNGTEAGMLVGTAMDAAVISTADDPLTVDRAFQDIFVNGMGAAALLADHAVLWPIEIVEPGETVELPLNYRFDTSAAAYDPYGGDRELVFSIHLHKVGLTAADGTVNLIETTRYLPGGVHVATGGEALGPWPFAVAGAVIALGIFAARHLRRDDEGAAVTAGGATAAGQL